MQSATQAINAVEQTAIRAAVHELLEEAKPAGERHADQRHPFFRPVGVATNAGVGPTVSAYARDISPMGLGLLHTQPLDREEVVVMIDRDAGQPVSLRTQIEWCKPSGEGWYLSGGRFLACVSTSADAF